MKKYGDDIDSTAAWNEKAQGYADRLVNDYHAHRLTVINALIPDDLYQEGKAVFDFGCGDAIHFEQFLSKGCRISGVDVADEMITLARQNLTRIDADPDLAKLGGAAGLAELPADSFDAVLSFNVLAYLTDEEETVFYEQAHRLLRPGGCLIVTHSNELFDMFSLNQYTVEFFRRHLVMDDELRSALPSLLTNASATESITTFNVRENPLTYRFKLARFGFVEQQQEFINLHAGPPPLLADDKPYADTLNWPEEDRWKLMFTCSTYGSLSVRLES